MWRIIIRPVLENIPVFLRPHELRILDRSIHNQFARKQRLSVGTQHQSYWERQSQVWEEAAPPVRPSAGELSIFSRFINKTGIVKRVLVLGSTPEIRDLITKVHPKAEVYVVDFSFSMIISMTEHTKEVDIGREKWLRCNWLDMPFSDNFFDLVVGDVVLHQLGPDKEGEFFTKIGRILKPSGRFVHRLFILHEEFLQQELSQVVDVVLQKQIGIKEKIVLIRLQAVWLFSDLKRRRFDRRKTAIAFAKLLKTKDDEMLKDIYQDLSLDKNSYRNWCPSTHENVNRLIKQTFTVDEECSASDYLVADLFPVVALSKKT